MFILTDMTWKETTIEQYQQILAIAKTDLPDFNKEIELVSYLFNISKNEIMNYPLEKFKYLAKKIDFLEDVYEGEMQTVFNLDGVEYEVHWKMETKTAGQFIDLSELTKDSELINDNLHKILAVICLPKGSKYDGNILERAEVFRSKLTMDVVFPIAGFFLTVLNNSLPDIQDYLSKKIQSQQRELLTMIRDSMTIGDGTAL
jgi:hypothetical protein